LTAQRQAEGAAAFFPAPDLLAYRVYCGTKTPVARLGAVSETEVPPAPEAGLFLTGPSFAFAGHVFRCEEPGVYRFWSPQLGSVQRVRLAAAPGGIASIAAELGALGNLDRDKTWPVMERIAGHQRLLMHCVQFSNLAVDLAARAGLSGRSWLMWNYAAAAAGDLLPSHAITELSCPTSGVPKNDRDPCLGNISSLHQAKQTISAAGRPI